MLINLFYNFLIDEPINEIPNLTSFEQQIIDHVNNQELILINLFDKYHNTFPLTNINYKNYI
jgi:hypothetical protein